MTTIAEAIEAQAHRARAALGVPELDQLIAEQAAEMRARYRSDRQVFSWGAPGLARETRMRTALMGSQYDEFWDGEAAGRDEWDDPVFEEVCERIA